MGVHKTSSISLGVHGAWESMGTHHQPPWESIKPRTAGVGARGGGRLNRGAAAVVEGGVLFGLLQVGTLPYVIYSDLLRLWLRLSLRLGRWRWRGERARACVVCAQYLTSPARFSTNCESDTGDGSKLDVRAKLDGFNLPKPGWGCMKCGGQGACRKRLGGTGNANHGEPNGYSQNLQNLQPQRGLQEWLEKC